MQTIKLTEEALISLLLDNQKKGYEYLYENYSPVLYNVIYRIVKSEDESDDVLQDVFVKIWKNIGQFDPKRGRLFTWMINLTRNTAIDKVRSQNYQHTLKNQSIHSLSYEVSGMSTTESFSIDFIDIHKFIDRLLAPEKMVVSMVYTQGYTHSEVAEKCGLPLGTVKSRVRNAMERIRGMVAEPYMPVMA